MPLLAAITATTRKLTIVNGHRAGDHAGSHDAFSFDITPSLTNGKNTLVVAA